MPVAGPIGAGGFAGGTRRGTPGGGFPGSGVPRIGFPGGGAAGELPGGSVPAETSRAIGTVGGRAANPPVPRPGGSRQFTARAGRDDSRLRGDEAAARDQHPVGRGDDRIAVGGAAGTCLRAGRHGNRGDSAAATPRRRSPSSRPTSGQARSGTSSAAVGCAAVPEPAAPVPPSPAGWNSTSGRRPLAA